MVAQNDIMKKKAYLKVCERFFTAWQKEDWEKVADATQLTWCTLVKDRGAVPYEHLETILGAYGTLKTYKITGHNAISDTTKDVKITATFTTPEIIKRKLIARVICESAPLTPSENGKWSVNPISLSTRR
jgi:hypothetical protein